MKVIFGRGLMAALLLCVQVACQTKEKAAVSEDGEFTSVPAETVKPVVPAMPKQQNKKDDSAAQHIAAVRPRPSVTPSSARAGMGIRISRVPVAEKLVALTFDDGPHAQLTPRILDVLNKYNAKGTFFALGQNVKRNPGIVRRAVAEGHEVGIHTWSHPQLTKCSREKIDSEIGRTRQAIIDASGQVPAVMRPPYGALSKQQNQYIYSKYGTPAILWDVDTLDWNKKRASTQDVINTAINGANCGSIILVHDIHQRTADSIEEIVRGLQARGFRLVTVSQLMAAAGGKSVLPARSSFDGVLEPAPAVPAVVPAAQPAPDAAMPAAEPVPAMEDVSGAAPVV